MIFLEWKVSFLINSGKIQVKLLEISDCLESLNPGQWRIIDHSGVVCKRDSKHKLR